MPRGSRTPQAAAAERKRARSAASGGVDEHGKQAKDGPGTWEALPLFANNRENGGPVNTLRRDHVSGRRWAR